MAFQVNLTYSGAGQFRCAFDKDIDRCLENLRQGEYINARITRPRSSKHQRTFFGVLGKAWENQRPVAGVPTFADSETMRGYLLIEAGHCETWDMGPESCTAETMWVLRRIGGYMRFYDMGDIVQIKQAKSIEFAKVDQDEFNFISRRVFDLIETDICPGLTIEDLKEQIGNDT